MRTPPSLLALLLATSALAAPRGRILYSSTRHGNSEIYLMESDGTHPRRLTDFKRLRPRDAFLPADDVSRGQTSGDTDPAWAPDAKRFAFVSSQGEDLDGNVVFVSDLAGATTTAVATSDWPISSLAWSPDGKRLALSEGLRRCSVVDVDRKTRTDFLSARKTRCAAVAWSPDGKRVAASLLMPNEGGYRIYVMDADGKGRRRVSQIKKTRGEWNQDLYPRWSPDGRRIAFFSGGASARDGLSVPFGQLWVVNPDGTNEHILAAAERMRASVSWSPDGRSLLLAGGDGGREDLYIVEANGSKTFRLTTDATGSNEPDWEPAQK